MDNFSTYYILNTSNVFPSTPNKFARNNPTQCPHSTISLPVPVKIDRGRHLFKIFDKLLSAYSMIMHNLSPVV